jgi:hypothetical protein
VRARVCWGLCAFVRGVSTRFSNVALSAVDTVHITRSVPRMKPSAMLITWKRACGCGGDGGVECACSRVCAWRSERSREVARGRAAAAAAAAAFTHTRARTFSMLDCFEGGFLFAFRIILVSIPVLITTPGVAAVAAAVGVVVVRACMCARE